MKLFGKAEEGGSGVDIWAWHVASLSSVKNAGEEKDGERKRTVWAGMAGGGLKPVDRRKGMSHAGRRPHPPLWHSTFCAIPRQ